jgi:predicted metallo-beta-lactamase superfamily hydrolase
MNENTNIIFTPLAAESLGVRSMSTYVETPDIKVLIDPGVSLGKRFGLLPHPLEYREIMNCRERINTVASKVDIITISHYHFDHATPTYTDYVWNFSSLNIAKKIYYDKIILAKDTRSSINASQRRTGWMLKKILGVNIKDFKVADNQTFTFGKTKLRFSKPVFHGEENTTLGWVLMLTIEYDGEKVMHASDVQGPILEETLDNIFAEHPKLVYISGPPIYLLDYRIKESTVHKSIENITRVDEWIKSIKPILETAETLGHKVLTAAEFLGRPNNVLESRRRELYKSDKPSEAFMKWMRLSDLKQKETPPPV